MKSVTGFSTGVYFRSRSPQVANRYFDQSCRQFFFSVPEFQEVSEFYWNGHIYGFLGTFQLKISAIHSDLTFIFVLWKFRAALIQSNDGFISVGDKFQTLGGVITLDTNRWGTTSQEAFFKVFEPFVPKRE